MRGTRDRRDLAQAASRLDAPSPDDPKRTNFARLDWGGRVKIDGPRREVEGLLGVPRPARMQLLGAPPSP